MKCARETCAEVILTKKTVNQKYCSDECCRLATNERLMRRYYEKQARKNGKVALCTDCDTKLSRYNEGSTCAACERKNNTNALTALAGAFEGVMIV